MRKVWFRRLCRIIIAKGSDGLDGGDESGRSGGSVFEKKTCLYSRNHQETWRKVRREWECSIFRIADWLNTSDKKIDFTIVKEGRRAPGMARAASLSQFTRTRDRAISSRTDHDLIADARRTCQSQHHLPVQTKVWTRLKKIRRYWGYHRCSRKRQGRMIHND